MGKELKYPQKSHPNPKFGQEYVKPGDNRKYIRYARAGLDLSPIDISDPDQVQNRLEEYLDFCEQNDAKPSVIGMANWLGVDRGTVHSWKRGEFRKDTHGAIIQRYMSLLEEIWSAYMMDGKINPASGIFIAKNVFGYRDVVDIAPGIPAPLGEEPNRKALEAKLADVVIDLPEEGGPS